MAAEERPWTPAADDELSWFRPGGMFPVRPRPLDFTLETYARTFGLTHALVSLNFPLYEVRARLVEGELYLASVPSGHWERDPETKTRLLWDSSLRYTRNIRAPWEHDGRQEVEGYNAWLAEAADAASSPVAAAERLWRARRVRGTQWYAMLRGVAGPLAMLRRRLAELPEDSPDRPTLTAGVEDGGAVLRDGLALVRDQGGAFLNDLVHGTAQRLVAAGALADVEGIQWLEWQEVRRALVEADDWPALVARRKATWEAGSRGPIPDTIGPTLPPGDPRSYLLRSVLDSLAG